VHVPNVAELAEALARLPVEERARLLALMLGASPK
jgi:hypothetical protein